MRQCVSVGGAMTLDATNLLVILALALIIICCILYIVRR